MKVVIAGDYCPVRRVADKLRGKDYDVLFQEIMPILDSADYSIVNFEFPVVTSPIKAKPIIKCGPELKGTIESIEALQYAGFNCCTLANNHILDQGIVCGLETKELIEQAGIDTVGFGNNLEDSSSILYKEINGEKLAIINCCEHEFSIATRTKAGANPLNPIRQFYSILDAKKNANYVIIIVHGGNEYYRLPSPRMKELYRFFVDVGANAVVNHHQHCYSGYEIYKGSPIVYGTGNFCFDYSEGNDITWHEGYLVELNFDAKTTIRTIPYIQCNKYPGVRLMNSEEKIIFDKTINQLNQQINDDTALNYNYSVFLKNYYSIVEIMFSPYSSRVGKGLCRRHLLPSFVSQKRKLDLLNYINCESHLPKVIAFLQEGLDCTGN